MESLIFTGVQVVENGGDGRGIAAAHSGWMLALIGAQVTRLSTACHSGGWLRALALGLPKSAGHAIGWRKDSNKL